MLNKKVNIFFAIKFARASKITRQARSSHEKWDKVFSDAGSPKKWNNLHIP